MPRLAVLWVEDSAEAQSPAIGRTGLWERWALRESGAAPFGVCLRRGADGDATAPFPTWEYRPPYLPEGLAIQMATSSHDVELPLVFFITFGRRPDSVEPQRRPPLEHPTGLRAITSVRIGVVGTSAVEAPLLKAVADACPTVSFVADDHAWMEVGIDDLAQRRVHDFRPQLPLVFRW